MEVLLFGNVADLPSGHIDRSQLCVFFILVLLLIACKIAVAYSKLQLVCQLCLFSGEELPSYRNPSFGDSQIGLPLHSLHRSSLKSKMKLHLVQHSVSKLLAGAVNRTDHPNFGQNFGFLLVSKAN